MKAYIDVDGITYRQFIEPKRITIIRAEGKWELCGIKQVCINFEEADAILWRNAATAPEHGGYDKHDFTVEYEDGYIYEGRYDLKHFRCEHPDLAAHMRSYMQYLAFDEKAAQYISEIVRDSAKAFLKQYNVKQQPIPVTPNENPEIIRDNRVNPIKNRP